MFYTPQDSSASFHLCLQWLFPAVFCRGKRNSCLISLNLPLPARCPPCHWWPEAPESEPCGERIKTSASPPSFLTHVVRGALGAAFPTCSQGAGLAAAAGSFWIKAGGAGGPSRALGQKTRIETPTSLAASCFPSLSLSTSPDGCEAVLASQAGSPQS